MSGAAGMIGGIIDGAFKFGESYESGRRAELNDKVGLLDLALAEKLSGEQLQWAMDDWNRFKTDFGPLEETMLARAREGIKPQTERVTGEANVEARQLGDRARQTIRSKNSATGVNPNSGSAQSAMAKADAGEALASGYGKNQARTNEQNRVEDVNYTQRAQMVSLGKGIPTQANANINAGAGLVNKGANASLALSRAYGNQQAQAIGGIGRAAGYLGSNMNWKGIGNKIFGGDNNYEMSGPGQSGTSFDADSYGSSVDPAYNDAGYAEGGMVVGPGTGRSDSIPAVIDGQHPARVSNREYIIPREVVAAVGGEDFFEDLINAARARH